MSMNAIVTISGISPPAICIGDGSVDYFESGGESFIRAAEYGDWLGFYDWLRTNSGIIVGVRVRIDQPKVVHIFQRYRSAEVTIEEDVISIRTSTDGAVCDTQSDDADFGGNAIFIGSQGSMAIAFFFPSNGKLLT